MIGGVISASISWLATVNGGNPPKAPSWTAYVTFALVALMFAWGPLYVCWTLGRGKGEGDDSGDGDNGGGGWGPGNTPPKTPPETDPEWWPEFERQFAAHVHRGSLPVKRAP